MTEFVDEKFSLLFLSTTVTHTLNKVVDWCEDGLMEVRCKVLSRTYCKLRADSTAFQPRLSRV